MNLKKIAFTLFIASIMSSAWAEPALDAAVAAAAEAVESANVDATSTETATDDASSDTTAIDAPVIEEAAE